MPETAANPPSRRRGRRVHVVLIVTVLALLVGGVALTGLWEFSSSPMFCNSCHIMKPYVSAWQTSKHNQVACVQCHYPPGFRDTIWVKYQALTQVVKWATQTYSSKPFAEVENGSCLRSGCHSEQALQEKVTYKHGIAFQHTPHLTQGRRGLQLRCTSCHTQTVVQRHIDIADTTCFLCHFKGTKAARELTPFAGCTGCHQPPKGDIRIGSLRFNHEEVQQRGVACQKCHLTVVQGDGVAPRERCFTCHNQPEKIGKYADTAVVHDVHVTTHNIECTRCHTEITHRLPPPIGLPGAADGGTNRLGTLVSR